MVLVAHPGASPPATRLTRLQVRAATRGLIQAALVPLQKHDRYCDGIAGSTIFTMNASPNTKQARLATRMGMLRRCGDGAVLVAAALAGFIGLSGICRADAGDPTPDFGSSTRAGAICQTEPWGFVGSQRRTLCDGPISADGSWTRERTIWVPAHRTLYRCTSGSGSSSSSSSCYGGYLVNQSLVSNESYPVRPETVLPDEPGHLS